MSFASERVNPVTLRFDDPQEEARFRAATDARCVRLIRIGALGGIVLMLLAAIVLQFALTPAMRGGLAVGPLALYAVAFVAVGQPATWMPSFARMPQAGVSILCILYTLSTVIGFCFLPPEIVAHRAYLFLLVHMFTINALLRLRLVPAFIATWLSIGLYALVMNGWSVIDDVNIAWHLFWLVLAGIWGNAICWQLDFTSRREFAAREEADRERARSDGLLLNILPAAIAAQLKSSQGTIAEHRDEVTVLFADLVGFTPLSAQRSPGELVQLLDRVFTGFDALAARHGLEKIKTIGDAYMAVAGLPQAQADHACRAARMGLDVLQAVDAIARETGERLEVRVGLHSGPVVAGVIGRSKFSYDLWGDTVNTASRMESLGLPGQVQCTPATADLLRESFTLHPRTPMEVKGKGIMQTFLLGPRPPAPVAPISGPAPLRIVFAGLGSRGDVQPMVALALEAKARGHDVVLAAPVNFAPWSAELGLRFAPCGVDMQKLLASDPAMLTGSALRLLRKSSRLLEEHMAAWMQEMLEATRDADALVWAGLGFVAPTAAEARRIACINVLYTNCWVPSSRHPPPIFHRYGLPGWANRWLWMANDALGAWQLGRMVNPLRGALGLPPRNIQKQLFSEGCHVIAADEKLFPSDPAWDPGQYPRTSFIHFRDARPLAAELDEWLRAGPPPVFAGFGSMSGRGPQRAMRALIDALAGTGHRCIVSAGWSQVDEGALPAGWRVVGDVAHAQLLPRVGVAIHHGGSGTTAAALRAGVPQVILPLLLDQYHHAHTLRRAGLGPEPVAMEDIGAACLRRSIDDALRVPRSALQAVAQRLQASDAAGTIVSFVESQARRVPA